MTQTYICCLSKQKGDLDKEKIEDNSKEGKIETPKREMEDKIEGIMEEEASMEEGIEKCMIEIAKEIKIGVGRRIIPD